MKRLEYTIPILIAKLQELGGGAPGCGPHEEMIRRCSQLSPATPLEERVGVFRALRASKALPECVGTALIIDAVQNEAHQVATQQADKLEERYIRCSSDLYRGLIGYLRSFLADHPLPPEEICSVFETLGLELSAQNLNLAPSSGETRSQVYRQETIARLRALGEHTLADLTEAEAGALETIDNEAERYLYGKTSQEEFEEYWANRPPPNK